MYLLYGYTSSSFTSAYHLYVRFYVLPKLHEGSERGVLLGKVAFTYNILHALCPRLSSLGVATAVLLV